MKSLRRSAGSFIVGMGVGPAIGAFGLASARGNDGVSANVDENGFAGAGGSGAAGLDGTAETDGLGSGGSTGTGDGVVTGVVVGGVEAAGLAGVLFSGAGSTNVKVSPDFASFTSVSTLPSGLRVDFTTLTVFSP